jgi:hypothetical protein
MRTEKVLRPVHKTFGMPVGLTDDSDEWRLVAKFTYEFGGR